MNASGGEAGQTCPAAGHRATDAMRDTLHQFVRYLLVGGGAFLVDFGTMALLLYGLHVHYLLAAGCGFVLGLVVNYIISIAWVFDRRRQQPLLEFAVFSLVGIVGLGLNHVVIWSLTEHVLAIPLLSKLAAAAVVLCWNFSARKILLF